MKRLLALLLPALALATGARTISEIDLSGKWQFSTDSTDFSRTIQLPGSMASNGLGDDIDLATPWMGQVVDSSFFKSPVYEEFRRIDNFKVPFWLQPVKYYAGKAWYRRTVDIPASWAGKTVKLNLERCHWQTRVLVDGVEAGTCNSLGTPHVYDLSGMMTPGRHTLEVMVDNRVNDVDPGCNSHSISDHTQGNWNGIVGKIELSAVPAVSIARTEVYPDIADRSIKTVTYISNRTGHNVSGRLDCRVDGTQGKAISEVELRPGDNRVENVIRLGSDVRLWDEFDPHLYTLKQSVTDTATGDSHDADEEFGMREIEARDGEIYVNGRRVFMRGTLDCAAFPLTGYPPTDVESWTHIMKTVKAHGLNHIRFHSWCPPEAAFTAADREGVYLQAECSSWANTSSSVGDGAPIDSYLRRESEAMLRAYGNHPSLCMMLYGNEPQGRHMTDYLSALVQGWKERDRRHIYTAGAGWPNLPVSDYLNDPTPRIQLWGAGTRSVINAKEPSTAFDFDYYVGPLTQPVVSHEIGQWCVYPNFREIEKYTGVMKPRNMEIFRTTLERNGMGELADSFLTASGKLQALCYKADIEAALRTDGMDGFQLLGLTDFPGQGTALVGVLDAFYGEKGYISPEEFSRFSAPTVPLLRAERLVMTDADTLRASLETAHFGANDLRDVDASWRLTDVDGRILASDAWSVDKISTGGLTRLRDIELPLSAIKEPTALRFEMTVDEYSNDWNLWVYPHDAETGRVMMTDRLDAKALDELSRGGSVLLSLRKGSLADDMGGNIQNGFSSIFWNTAWTLGQAPHTLGVLVEPSHPALASFPTAMHSDYQWWDAMSHSHSTELDKVAPGLKPVVRVIDDWFTNRPLGLLFEAKVGGGKLMVSGIDFHEDMENRPAARQLLHSLENYMTSDRFNPATEVAAEAIVKLVK